MDNIITLMWLTLISPTYCYQVLNMLSFPQRDMWSQNDHIMIVLNVIL